MDINVAVSLFSTVSQSSTYQNQGASLGADGDLLTSMHSAVTDEPKWWKIDLNYLMPITRAVIYTKIYTSATQEGNDHE